MLVVGGDPPALTFGLYQGGSNVDPRLTVSAEGDVTATGTIKGALTQGEIRVQSGTVTHGLVIPLPDGVTQDQVDRGAVILHLHLTPHTPQSAAGKLVCPGRMRRGRQPSAHLPGDDRSPVRLSAGRRNRAPPTISWWPTVASGANP